MQGDLSEQEAELELDSISSWDWLSQPASVHNIFHWR